MAHSAQPPSAPRPPRRNFEKTLGVLFVVLAIVAGVFAFEALRHPKGKQAGVASSAQLTGVPSTNAATSKPNATGGSKATSPTSSTAATITPPTTSGAPSTSAPTTAPATSAATTPATSPPAVAGRLPLVVLNNTSQASTATAVARFQAGGWSATDGGGFDGSILSTAAYYDPDADGSRAAALALQSQFPAIKRVLARFAGLPSGPVVVVLTSDYS